MLCSQFLSAADNRLLTQTSIVPEDQKISDFDARLALAKILSYNDKTLTESLAEYNILMEQKPDALEIRLDMAKIFIRQNKYQDALSHLNYLLSINPNDSEILSLIGNIYLYINRLKDAIIYYNKAFAANPSSYEIQKKLALAQSWDRSDENALPLLLDIHQKNPEDKEVTIELSRLYSRRKKQQKAFSLLEMLRARYPDDYDITAEMASIEASLGHAQKCRQLYIDALKMSDNNEKILLRYADAMNMWGDFYKIEKIYRDYLRTHPDSKDIMLKLAWSLVSSERYEEAEGMYRILLLDSPDMPEALLGMAKLKLMEKDYVGALAFSETFLLKKPGDFEALSLKAKALSYLKKYEDASKTYDEIITRTDKKEIQIESLIGKGKIYLKQGDNKTARRYFEKAYELDAQSVSAQFYLTGIEHIASFDFINNIIEKEHTSTDRITKWAELYALHGLYKEAIMLYGVALKKDSEFFPASMGLAQMYAIDKQYRDALYLLADLDRNLPDTSKIMIWQARALAWSKDYSKSIETYRRIRQLNSKDPVPQKEMARVAVWGKMMDDADKYYKEMYTPPVDKELLETVKPALKSAENGRLLESLETLEKTVDKNLIYKGYERFSGDFESYRQTLPSNWRIHIEKALLELLPAYMIQKNAFLENRSKRFAWHKRFIHALESYEELIDASPGNQEAIFDYAQSECSLGLCEREEKTYKALLNIDPLHSLAGIAIERQKIRKSPYLEFNYNYWMEDGRGDLSQISRNRFDFTFKVPMFCQYYAGITFHRWFENPWYNHKTYAADGYSLFLGGVVNPFIKGEAKWTYKKYSNSEISPRDTGHAFLWLNLKDYAHIGGGYEKADEIYNYFGIQQGAQSDSWWMGVRSDITRKLELNGKARFINYNDSNSGQHHQLSAGYAVTDHPRIFKVIMSGEYRNTQHENVSIYRGSSLINIIHPYWTPQNYTATGITFEWYHDYSKLFFCGNELRFYDIKVFFGTDTENNPSAKLEAELHHQFFDNWTIGIKGMINSSPQWNASGVWATLKYQF